MIRTLAIAAAVSALVIPASAAAAAADPAFDAFHTICWAPADDYVGVLKAATDAGWTDTAVSGGDEQGVSITDKAAKEKAAEALEAQAATARQEYVTLLKTWDTYFIPTLSVGYSW